MSDTLSLPQITAQLWRARLDRYATRMRRQRRPHPTTTTGAVMFENQLAAVVANLEARPWIQGEMQVGDAVCAHGAVMTCQGLLPGGAQIIRAVMRAKGVTEEWNDTPGRTKTEVLQALRAIEVSDADLEATFGPCWRRVIAVIRRAAVLTEDEAERMSSAWDAARVAAMFAPRVAAWDASRAAAWDASRVAAWDAARDAAMFAPRVAAWDAPRVAVRVAAWVAARDAARDAAIAVAVEDLVGQHGLTQDHIDTLMAPWITVLGDDWDKQVTS